MDSNKTHNVAKDRWLILRNGLLRKRTSDIPSPVSIRAHNSVDLFQVTEEIHDDKTLWLKYKHDGTSPLTALVKKPPSELDFQDLFEGDNTGNVCIWASEQVLARYCIVNINQFHGTSVIELGGGSTCLAGLFVAKYGNAERVILSDGNIKAVANVKHIVERNFSDKSKLPEAAQIQWDDAITVAQYAAQFDYVICADCLFRDDIRNHLALAIFNMLKPDGHAIIFAPQRANSMNDFLNLAKRIFGDSGVTVVKRYDEKVWQFHQSNLNVSSYNENIHYPYLIKLTKNSKHERIITAASSA